MLNFGKSLVSPQKLSCFLWYYVSNSAGDWFIWICQSEGLFGLFGSFWSEPCFKSCLPSHNVAFHIWSVQLPPTHCDERPPNWEMMIEWWKNNQPVLQAHNWWHKTRSYWTCMEVIKASGWGKVEQCTNLVIRRENFSVSHLSSVINDHNVGQRS